MCDEVRLDRPLETGARAQAPGRLAHVQSFVNTIDIEEGREDLASPQALGSWLLCHGFLAGYDSDHITEEDWQTAVALREAIRALLIANAGGPPAPAAVDLLNHLAQEAVLGVTFDVEGVKLEAHAPGFAGAIGQMLIIVFDAMRDGSWPRLKACRSDRCQWAYFDTSKNRSGAWCLMAICGNKVKTRSYRTRQRKQADNR